MKNHVVSLELAKQLKEARYPQKTEYWWICYMKTKDEFCTGIILNGHACYNPDGKYSLSAHPTHPDERTRIEDCNSCFRQGGRYEPYWDIDNTHGHFAAPLATELLEQLPRFVWLNNEGERDLVIYPSTSYKQWFVSYKNEKHQLKTIQSESLPDALAMMYLYLKKEELI